MIDFTNVKTVLAFFAHPDDETLGAGATIAKLSRKGAKVHVAIPATGITSRAETSPEGVVADLSSLKKDTLRAVSILGVKPENLSLGSFDDNKLDSYPLLELIQWLEEIIENVKPDLILTHHRFCTNVDHQRCHEAAVVATRPGVSQHIPVLCAEVPSSTGYLKPVNWEPNFFVDIASKDLDKKVEAMQSYEGESRPDPHPRSPEVLRALAKVRGADAGFLFAEAFMIQKCFA